MKVIEWSEEKFSLGYSVMDDTHREFVDMVNRLAEAKDDDFPALFNAFVLHTQDHFDREEVLMKKTSFPASAEHSADHRRILGELRHFKRRVDHGILIFARNYIRRGIADWFTLHLNTMDSALAAHLNRSGEISLVS